MDRVIREGVCLAWLVAISTGCATNQTARVDDAAPTDAPTGDAPIDATRPTTIDNAIEQQTSGPTPRPLAARGEHCDDAIALDPGVLQRGETPSQGMPSALCAVSDAPQRFYSFVLPAGVRAVVSVTSRTRGVRVVLRALARCDATSCLRDETTRINGQTATLAIDSPGNDASTKIVSVSSITASLPADFDIGVRFVPLEACVGELFQPAEYFVTEIAPLAGDITSTAADLDDVGGVVANSIDATGHERAFVWRNGATTELPSLGGSTRAYAMNSYGDVAGVASDAHGTIHPVVWRRGAIVDLAPPDSIGIAYDISDSGTVVGFVNRRRHQLAVMWDRNNVMTEIPLSGSNGSLATAINDFDQIVGAFETTGVGLHAFLFDRGTVTDLGAPSDARAIANDGSIVTNGMDAAMQPTDFIFAHDAWANVSSKQAFASGIGDSQRVVGWLPPPPSGGLTDRHAFVTDVSFTVDSITLRDLNDEIDELTGWTLNEATRINSCGRIVGTGLLNSREAFLLTPMCPAGLAECRGRCVDLTSDTANCGACDAQCPGGCHSSTCSCPPEVCNGLDDDCNGVIDDLAVPILRCGVGVCLRAVPACVSGTSMACVAGTPEPDVCNGADDDCDGVIDNGCAPCPAGKGRCGSSSCVDFASDRDNCGVCGHACASGEHCTLGVCG